MTKILIQDLRLTMETMADCHIPQPERRFHKDDEYLSFGLKTPDFRVIMKTFAPRFKEFSLQKRFELAVGLLDEHIGELGHAGIHVVALSVNELEPSHFSILDHLANDFQDWSHVDHFCGDVLGPLLGKYQEAVLHLLEEWNQSPNRWKRRASVVSFTRKVGKSGKYVDEVLRLCENLIWDKEDIVLKGVGWALKDNLHSAPEKVLPYITDLRRRGVSSTIILYAIRNLKGPERQSILSVK